MQTFAVRDARVKSTALPFALGLEGPQVISIHPLTPAAAVVITEHAYPFEQEDPAEQFRYHVRTYRRGVQVACEGTDTLGDAEALARHLGTPLPTAARHTASDELWWAAHAPVSYQATLPALSGGAPEPEAICGLSGTWYLPGEDDLEPLPVDRDADLPTGGWLGHDS